MSASTTVGHADGPLAGWHKDHGEGGAQTSPWLRDSVLFSVAVWWVRANEGAQDDFARQVTREFSSLVRDLRHETL